MTEIKKTRPNGSMRTITQDAKTIERENRKTRQEQGLAGKHATGQAYTGSDWSNKPSPRIWDPKKKPKDTTSELTPDEVGTLKTDEYGRNLITDETHDLIINKEREKMEAAGKKGAEGTTKPPARRAKPLPPKEKEPITIDTILPRPSREQKWIDYQVKRIATYGEGDESPLEAAFEKNKRVAEKRYELLKKDPAKAADAKIQYDKITAYGNLIESLRDFKNEMVKKYGQNVLNGSEWSLEMIEKKLPYFLYLYNERKRSSKKSALDVPDAQDVQKSDYMNSQGDIKSMLKSKKDAKPASIPSGGHPMRNGVPIQNGYRQVFVGQGKNAVPIRVHDATKDTKGVSVKRV